MQQLPPQSFRQPQPQPQQPPRRGVPWLALFAIDASLSVLTFVVFGVIGGLFMIIALNGFDGRRGGQILFVYAALVLVGNALFACLVNWLVLRARDASGARGILLPALTTTILLLAVGPPLTMFLIQLLFSR